MTAQVRLRLEGEVGPVPAGEWDAHGGDNPFISHAFLSALEDSGSVGEGTGWQPLPLILEGADGGTAGVLPAYAKSHSQGEYVFDHAWADAWERAGGHYYPKLQIAAPFSPVPGPRLLCPTESRPALIAGAQALVDGNGLSSAHATFLAPEERDAFEAAGWLIREGLQFHWFNDGYATFDDFLGALSSRKRKTIRRERRDALAEVAIRRYAGDAITEALWDRFWLFYQDTGARKWGRPYLTRPFFSLLGERMGERLILLIAERDGQPIAGALNLVGGGTLYGRYWGTLAEVPFLHFELCYYQAIELAIERGLTVVEAGAQGEHKLARGYRPTPTWSAHYIPDLGFRAAVADFVARERRAVEGEVEFLESVGPFRREG